MGDDDEFPWPDCVEHADSAEHARECLPMCTVPWSPETHRHQPRAVRSIVHTVVLMWALRRGPPNNPQAAPVELAGATGALAGVINGLYEPAGPRVHERPAYRKQGGGDVWVCCGRTGRWWVTDAAGKGGASGWARSLHGICFTLS